MSALDGRPSPAARLGWCHDHWIRAQCDGCQRCAAVAINALLDVVTLPRDMPMWQVAFRLRCRECGERAGRWDVAEPAQLRRCVTPGTP